MLPLINRNTKPDSDFKPDELTDGMKDEMEHTSRPGVAKSIAKDHLEENPNYYHDNIVERGKPVHINGRCIPTKKASLATVGEAALIGLLLGKAARLIPGLDDARINNPAVYDAALGAAIVASLPLIHSSKEEGRALPGSAPYPQTVPPPGWNLM